MSVGFLSHTALPTRHCISIAISMAWSQARPEISVSTSAKETKTEFQVSTVLFGDMDHHLGAREIFLNPNFLHLTLPGFSTARNNNQYVL